MRHSLLAHHPADYLRHPLELLLGQRAHHRPCLLPMPTRGQLLWRQLLRHVQREPHAQAAASPADDELAKRVGAGQQSHRAQAAEDAVQGEAKDLVAFARTRLEENMEIAQATLGRLQEMASSGLASPEAAAAVAWLQAAVSSSLSEYDLSDISGAFERAAPGVTEWNDKVSDKIREVMGAKDDYFSAVDDVLRCQRMGLFGEGASTLLGQLSGGGEEVSGGGSEDAPGGDVPRGGEDPGSTGEADVPPPPPSGGDEDEPPPPPPPPPPAPPSPGDPSEEATSASAFWAGIAG